MRRSPIRAAIPSGEASSAPRASAIAGSTSAGSRSAASGTKTVPPSASSASRRDSSIEKRVLPVPPGPMMVRIAGVSVEHERDGVVELALPTEEPGRRSREEHSPGRPERRVALPSELKQLRRPVEVLQPMPTEVCEGDPVDQRRGRLGDQHLSAVGQRRHTGSAVDVDTHVSLGGEGRRPGVQSHSDTDRAGLERQLPGLGGGDRAGSGRECDEERVALRVDLDAVVRGERGP